MKINLLFIDKSKIFAGAEYSLLSLLESLDKSKYNSIICVNYSQVHHENYINKGFSVISRNKSLKWWMGSDFSLRAFRGSDLMKRIIFAMQLAWIIRRYKIDICHINLLRDTDKLDIVILKILGCPVVGHIRSLQTQAYIHRLTLNLCDRLICTSDKVLSDIEMLKSKTFLQRIYDPIDVLKYDTSGLDINKLREEYSIDKSAFTLSSVAIIDKRKGHDSAILVLKELLKLHNNIILIIAGGDQDPDEKRRLKDLVSEQKISDRVIFTGHINDIKNIYAISDVILALSHDGEAFGRVPLEAAAARRVVITTGIGAALETVVDKTTGYLVDPGNNSEVAEIVNLLISSQILRQLISDAAYQHVLHKFSAISHARYVESIYNSL
jgi:glycosyltransferase involved in cell wall biosynthesis